MLLGNYSVLAKSPGRHRAGSTTSVENGVRSNWNRSSDNRNVIFRADNTTALKLYARPTGYYPPGSWTIPQVRGEMAGVNAAAIAFTSTAPAISAGRNVTGVATFALSTGGTAQLVVSATGSAQVTFSSTAALAGALFATGTGSITFAAEADVGAQASATGAATLTFSAAATIRAIGHLAGDITPFTELSPQNLAAAVWERVIEAGFTAEEIVRLLAASAAGAATGLEGANPQFTGLDGVTVRIDGAYSGGTRTINVLDGV